MSRRAWSWLLWVVVVAFFTAVAASYALAEIERWWSAGPAPTCTSFSSTGNSGGNVTMTCSGLVASPLPRVMICASPCGQSGGGTWGALSTPVSSATTSAVEVTIPATTCTAGNTCNYDILVANALGQASVTRQVPLIFGENTPLSCISSVAVKGWWRADSDTNTGCSTNATATVDKSGSGNPFTSFNNFVHHCSDGTFDNEAYWACDGSSSYAINTAYANSTHTLWCQGAIELVAAGSNPVVMGTGYMSWQGSASTGQIAVCDGNCATWGSSIVGSTVSVSGYDQGTGSSAENIGVALDGQSYVTNTGSGTELPTTFPLSLCANTNPAGTISGQYAQVKVADFFCVDGVPTSAEKSCGAQYLNERYQLSPAPTLTACTALGDSTSSAQSLRCTGANFVTGMNINITVNDSTTSICNSATTATATVVSSSIVEIQCPSGALTDGVYDLTLTNPDNGSTSNQSAVTVTGAPSPMQIFGAEEKLYVDSRYVTTSGGNIATWLDESLRGNTVTTSNNVAYTASDSAFLGLPSGTWNGSNSYAYAPAVNGVAANDAILVWAVFKVSTPVTGGMIAQYTGTDTLRFDQRSAGVPGIFFNGVGTSWGSAVTSVHICWVYETGGSSWTQGVSCDNGTPVTASQSGTGLGAAGLFTMGDFGTDTGSLVLNGKIVAEGLVDFGASGTASSAELNNLCLWSHTIFGTPSTNCATQE